MKWPHRILYFLLFLPTAEISGQDFETKNCSGYNSFLLSHLKDNIADPRLSLYDVTFYYIDI
jgi:hypothetical protein